MNDERANGQNSAQNSGQNSGQYGNASFYDALAALPSFHEATVGTVTHAVPADWHVVLSDVEGSTEAIHAGRYKQVNMLGAAVIACSRTLSAPHGVPFVFGGDGATLAVPAQAVPRLRSGLASIRKMGIDAYGLKIRIATVPVSSLTNQGLDLRLCKYSLSPANQLAAWYGDGWLRAEDMLKSGDLPEGSVIPEDDVGNPEDMDLTGLQCRWDFLESKRGFKSCFIIVIRTTDPSARLMVMDKIAALLKADHAGDSPSTGGNSGVGIDDLKLAFKSELLKAESGARSRNRLTILAANFGARLLFLAGKWLPGIPGTNYRKELIENTDFVKFDGSLKFVVDCSKQWLRTLIDACEGLEREGLIWYGQHSSKRAILTCLVPSLEKHIHFIDGSDGGYAAAAKILKTKIRGGR